MTTDPLAGATAAIEGRLFRALAVLRVVLTLNAIGLNLWRRDNFERPLLALALVVAIGAWTAYVIWAYAGPRRRRAALLVADLAVALATLVLTPAVKGADFNATVPGFWIAGAMLAWAIHWRWLGGLVAAALLCVTDVAIRDHLSQTNYANLFLVMIAGPIVGYLGNSLIQMARERDAALRTAAVAAERTRLARAVHDGVLQVLALVQRKGGELGGDFASLGALAGEQEAALRSLIRQQDGLAAAPDSATLDLAGELERLALRRPHVSVVTPGGAVAVGAERTREVVAVVSACLDNVDAHVGADAPAWVLLDLVGDDLVVSVRDEGPGISEGRLDQAAAQGRLGVSESIRGRVRDLGGTAVLDTGGFGTEWEFTIPR